MPEVKLALSERESVCLACGLVLDRDLNAALHVFQVGIAGLPGGTTPVHLEKADHRLGRQTQSVEPYTIVT